MEAQIEGLVTRVGRAYAALGLGLKLAIAVGGVLTTTAVGIAMVVWIPPDHFTDRRGQPDPKAQKRTFLRWTVLVVRNTFGAVLVVLGAVMALPLVPGPGLVFILVGFSLTDFPGKRRVERRLLGVPSVIRFINEVRSRFGRAPLLLDDPDADEARK
jgi:hypothetical protein